jgi:hypothetical protein
LLSLRYLGFIFGVLRLSILIHEFDKPRQVAPNLSLAPSGSMLPRSRRHLAPAFEVCAAALQCLGLGLVGGLGLTVPQDQHPGLARGLLLVLDLPYSQCALLRLDPLKNSRGPVSALVAVLPRHSILHHKC